MVIQKTPEKSGTLPSYEHVYTEKDLIELRGKLWLHISLAEKNILLPMVNVGSDETPIGIAFYDPALERNPRLAEVSVTEMERHFTYFHAGVVMKTDSTKSGWFIEEAAKRVGAIVVNIPSGRDEEDVARRSLKGSVRSYVPVTLLGSGYQKFIGAPKHLVDVMKYVTLRKQIVVAEDVGTTWATLNAMGEAMRLGGLISVPYSIALIAREGKLGVDYPPRLGLTMRATIALPEIEGLDASKMVHIRNREDIPRAIIL